MNAPRNREQWIESSSSACFSELARTALVERLDLVRQHLPRAAKKRNAPIESVHQLRVSTRRAASALRVFAELLDTQQRKHMQRWLGEMRRAAGDARDLDVLYLRLGPQLVERRERLGLRCLDFLLQLRQAAQQPLAQLKRDYSREFLTEQRDHLIDTVQWRGAPPEPTVSEASHERLLPLIRDFFTAAAEDLSDPHRMHQMRIAGKRLRYALELFGGAYDASLREDLYPIFIEVQDHLGLVNDYVTSQTRLLEWSDKTSGKLRRYMRELVAEEKTRYEAQVEEFHRWWNPQRVQDLHHRFIAILRQNGKLQDLKLVGE